MFRKWLNAAAIAFLLTIVALALSQAGPLEPSAPPGPTMKTLDEIPPTWRLILPAEQRYVIVMNGEAVLDKETGLVWERSPHLEEGNWAFAVGRCHSRSTGGRGGWRLPSMSEAKSLGVNWKFSDAGPFDMDCSDEACYSGHHWASTTDPADGNAAYVWASGSHGILGKGNASRIACVRGGYGTDSGR